MCICLSLCEPCPSGMDCPGGWVNRDTSSEDTKYHAQPSVRPGMWASISAKYQPYKCEQGGRRGTWVYGELRGSVSYFECPGGPAGECAPWRTGTACTKCVEGYFRFNGACLECFPFHRLTLVAMLALMAIFCYATYHMTGGSTMLHQLTTLLGVTMSLGNIVTYLQMMGLFCIILFDWHLSSVDGKAWSSVLTVLRLALFDFGEALTLDCWSSNTSPLGVYIARMLIPLLLYG
ncbi:hypothetical protein FOZ63_000479, partial [Perkinsus olseni]